MLPFVIQVFSPFRTHAAPSRRAVVRIPAGFEPKSGSVNPKQPKTSPDGRGGSHFDFCCALPNVRIGYITRAPWTDTKLLRPESPRSSSCMTRPYSVEFIPAQP